MAQADAATQFMEAMDRRDWEAAFEVFTVDCHWHSPGTRIDTVGRDAAKRQFAAFVEQTGARYRLVDVHEHQNLTTIFFDGEATHDGQRVEFPGVVVIRWEGGKVAELWGMRG